jgi:hypothetical protein
MLCLQTAERLAAALDAEDYGAVRACLSANCVYHGPDGVLTGPDAIVASYRQVAEAGRERFEEIKYESQALLAGPDSVIITFTDHLRLGRAWHRFRCRQHVRVGVDGLVEAIQHEEIPGERERLHQFETEAAPRKAIAVPEPGIPVTFRSKPVNDNLLPPRSANAPSAPLLTDSAFVMQSSRNHVGGERCPFCRKPVALADERCPHCGEALFEDDASLARSPRDASAQQGLQWLIPIGRSGWSIAAGYLGLLSCIPIVGMVLGPLAITTGVLGLRHAARNPALGGRGRAIFGIALGTFNFLWAAFLITAVVVQSIYHRH